MVEFTGEEYLPPILNKRIQFSWVSSWSDCGGKFIYAWKFNKVTRNCLPQLGLELEVLLLNSKYKITTETLQPTQQGSVQCDN